MYDISPSFGLHKRIEWNVLSKSQRNRKDHNGIGCIWVMEMNEKEKKEKEMKLINLVLMFENKLMEMNEIQVTLFRGVIYKECNEIVL